MKSIKSNHSLSLIPHLRLRALNDRKVKWPTAFHFLGSVWQEHLQKLDWTSWPTSCKHFRLNCSSFFAKAALARFCGIFFVGDELDAIVVLCFLS